MAARLVQVTEDLCKQRVQIGDHVPRRARLRNRVAAAREEQGTIRVEVRIDLAGCPRTV
jgi:hypothetical protein